MTDQRSAEEHHDATDPHAGSTPDSVGADEDLPRWVRILLIAAGSVFLLIGVVMLAIPVLPQVWAFALAAVCFSVASPAVWEWLERKLRRWPKFHDRAERSRSKMVDRLSRKPKGEE